MKHHALVPSFRDNMKFIRDLPFVQDVRYQPKGTTLDVETETSADHRHEIFFTNNALLTISQFMINGEYRYLATMQVDSLLYNGHTVIDPLELPTTHAAVLLLKALRKSNSINDALAHFFTFVGTNFVSTDVHTYAKQVTTAIRDYAIDQRKVIYAADSEIRTLRNEITSTPEYKLLDEEVTHIRQQISNLQARLNNLVAKQSTMTDPVKRLKLKSDELNAQAALRIPFPFIKI